MTECRLLRFNASKIHLFGISIYIYKRTEKDGERQSWRSTPDRDKIGKGTKVHTRDRSAEELDRETGEDQATVGRTRRKEGGW